MKKTLAALAVLSAFAGSALAADVTLYGRADLGLRYSHVDGDQANKDAVDTFEMASGNYSGSRFGLKGTEELGNGLKVGFVLENGFNADDGSLKTSGRLFDREAIIRVMGNFGELGFGRTSILSNDANTYGIGSYFSALGTGWGDVGGQDAVWGAGYASRMDNVITYVTPEFAGVKVYAQYSFGANTYKDDDKLTREEGKTTTDRYYGLGMTYDAGNLALAAIVDSTNRSTAHKAGEKKDVEDAVRVILGGTYEHGAVKPNDSSAYFKDRAINDIGGMLDQNNSAKTTIEDIRKNHYFDGSGVVLGAKVPAFGGAFYGNVGYLDADSDSNALSSKIEKIEVKRWFAGIGYDYSLSKRTTVYADLGYAQDKWEQGKTLDAKPSMFQGAVGLMHSF